MIVFEVSPLGSATPELASLGTPNPSNLLNIMTQWDR